MCEFSGEDQKDSIFPTAQGNYKLAAH
jgi:hypothetical protein